MSSSAIRDTQDTQLAQELESARSVALASGLPYAGGVSPTVAWKLVSAGDAVLVDVRSAEELKFVGHVPDSLHVPWATGTALHAAGCAAAARWALSILRSLTVV